MAEDEKAPKEEAETPQETPKGRRSRKGRKVDPPVSLYPLSFEEAIDGLLQVKPDQSDDEPGDSR